MNKATSKLLGFETRLMSHVKDVEEIPREAESLIIVADVGGSLHFRILATDGHIAVDIAEIRLAYQASRIAELKSMLTSWWGQSSVPKADEPSFIETVESIVSCTLAADEAHRAIRILDAENIDIGFYLDIVLDAIAGTLAVNPLFQALGLDCNSTMATVLASLEKRGLVPNDAVELPEEFDEAIEAALYCVSGTPQEAVERARQATQKLSKYLSNSISALLEKIDLDGQTHILN